MEFIVPFKNFLTEAFLNLFSTQQKEAYADEVWTLLQASYASIGGLKGNGFQSKEKMIEVIPFWKLVRKNGKLVAGAFYKDKQGRKRVAVFTNGTPEGKKALTEIYKADFDRAYFEVSGPSFGLIVKLLGPVFVASYAKTPEQATQILKEPLEPPNPKELMYMKFPELQKYMYGREIGGHVHTKIMLGTSGKKLVVTSPDAK